MTPDTTATNSTPQIALTPTEVFARIQPGRERDALIFEITTEFLSLVEETYRAVMEIPITNPKMDDSRRRISEWNNAETNESIQAFLLKEEAENIPLGKHFHEKKSEAFVILGGVVEKLLMAQGSEMTDRQEFTSLGRGWIIVIPPNTAHTFYMKPGSRMICFSDAAFNPNAMDMTAVNLV